MSALGDDFSCLCDGKIDAPTFEHCLCLAVLYVPTWNPPEEPQLGWRPTQPGEYFMPLLLTRANVPLMPIFEDANQIGPWLANRGENELAKKLSFLTMHGLDLLKSIDPRVHIVLVLTDGRMVEFDPGQLSRIRESEGD